MGFPSGHQLLWNAMLLIPLVLSLTVHEWAHAISAYWLGDDTAARQGRMTLNPLVHMDPVGTFLFPLLGVPFGWAKPVPVQPHRFRKEVNQNTGMMLTALAGPASNFLLAVGMAVLLGLLERFAPSVAQDPAISFLLRGAKVMNVGLAIFNLIPIPPLDGSRVVEWLLPYQHRAKYDAFARLAPAFFVVLMFAGGRFLNGPIEFVAGALNQLTVMVAG